MCTYPDKMSLFFSLSLAMFMAALLTNRSQPASQRCQFEFLIAKSLFLGRRNTPLNLVLFLERAFECTLRTTSCVLCVIRLTNWTTVHLLGRFAWLSSASSLYVWMENKIRNVCVCVCDRLRPTGIHTSDDGKNTHVCDRCALKWSFLFGIS